MYKKESPLSIQSLFNSIAKNYDRANSINSFNFHKLWNRKLVAEIRARSSHKVFLDLCSGTGDIAQAYLRASSVPCEALLVDFSSEMLQCAKQKMSQTNFKSIHQVSYLQADVQNLPLPAQFADCAAMAYGIRNVADPSQTMREIFRVLKPGGYFALLELTRPKGKILKAAHKLYLQTFIPFFGKWIADNEEAYNYLCNSIQSFISPDELQKLMMENGFINTQNISLTGGIATIVMGYKNK